MSRICSHSRDRSLARRMPEESLQRLQTDHLDLRQIHGVAFENDPDLFIRPNGAAEALRLAKDDRVRPYASDGRLELFKTTVKYDGDIGRELHGFPSAQELPA